MKYFKLNHISKEEFENLKEEDVMFITHPGRMGDEDGSTFIVRKDNSLVAYRVEHWMYNHEECEIDYLEFKKHFPKWVEAHSNENNSNKYKLYYMGFGNDLCVDLSIVDVFEKHLESCIQKRALQEHLDSTNSKYVLTYNSWEEAAYLTVQELEYKKENKI